MLGGGPGCGETDPGGQLTTLQAGFRPAVTAVSLAPDTPGRGGWDLLREPWAAALPGPSAPSLIHRKGHIAFLNEDVMNLPGNKHPSHWQRATLSRASFVQSLSFNLRQPQSRAPEESANASVIGGSCQKEGNSLESSKPRNPKLAAL